MFLCKNEVLKKLVFWTWSNAEIRLLCGAFRSDLRRDKRKGMIYPPPPQFPLGKRLCAVFTGTVFAVFLSVLFAIIFLFFLTFRV
jgi:hypothetical protein